VRAVVRAIEPYEWEESTEALARRTGLRPEQILRFDMNTSPLAPAGLDDSLETVRSHRRVNEYVDARYTALTEAIGAYNGVEVDNILVGAGADEVLGVVVGAFIEPGRRTAMLTPTFPMCAIYTEQHGGTVTGVPYDEGFSGPVEGLIEAAQEANLVFVCSPNNPSGTAFALEEVERIVSSVPCAVVVDEAYYEYHGQTVLPLIKRYPQLIVVRTFSKAFGMAGARVGYCMAAPEMISLLNRLRPPNSVNYVGGLLALAALERLAEVRRSVEAVLAEREALRAALEGLGLEVWPSRGNFLLTRFREGTGSVRNEGVNQEGVENPTGGRAPTRGAPTGGRESGAEAAARVHRHLLNRGLVLRSYRGHPRLAPCLRVTVRTATENGRLLEALGEVLRGDG
jgi:histidinol-phosphate aminotransferase